MYKTGQNSVAVVIPSHNRAGLLPRALNSILRQSLPPTEIILVDDGSSDHTEKLIKNDFSTVQYLYQAHTGVCAARNAGVAASSSNWIAFLDSDDEWHVEKLARQWQAIQRHPDFAICHTDEIWIRNGRRVNPMNKHAKAGGWIYQSCLPLCAMSPSTTMIQRSMFLEAGGFDESLPACEDYDLWLRICAVNPVLYLADKLVNKYGGHDDQLSRRYWGMDRFRIQAMEKMMHSGVLSPEDARATTEMLCKKIAIMLNGSTKRKRREDINYYQDKLDHWAQYRIDLNQIERRICSS